MKDHFGCMLKEGRVLMVKNVIISVKGTQYTDNQDANAIELVTEGKYYKDGNVYYIKYDESEVTGMSGTTTTLKVADGTVLLSREGSVNSQFVFHEGQKHVSYYDTEYGTFTISVLANEVNINIDDSGGEIRIWYHMEIDNNQAGDNDFLMSIREAGQTDDKHNRRN